MAAAVELEKTRELVTALDAENASLRSRLETERQITTLLSELNITRKGEADALRATVTSKNETISAKEAVIASQDKLIVALKQNKPSPWRRLGDIVVGAAVLLVLK